MLGIKGVVLGSALKFLNKNNKKKSSWEFRLSNSNDSHTCHPQIISSYKVLSLFPWNHLLRRSKSYWYLRNFTLLSFSSMTWSDLYSALWDFVRHCTLYHSLDHWEEQHRSHHCSYEGEKKRGIKEKNCILGKKNKYGCIWASYAASLASAVGLRGLFQL